MLHIIICRIIAWLYEVGRNAFIQDRDRETNLWCAVGRSNLGTLLGIPY